MRNNIISARFPYPQAIEVEFKMRIKERGSRFNETIKISEKKNIVSFMVPKHKDIHRSEVQNDFNLVS
jgi:hypothetical protein